MTILQRREFITVLGGAGAWPLAARAQCDRMRRIGVLMGLDEKRSCGEASHVCIHASACGLGLDRWPQHADGPSVGRR
jgi:putative ABC transport system substrate-binding protein